MFGESVHLTADGEYGDIYQKVQTYLSLHFTRLPRFEMYYDAKGLITSENKRHQIVKGNGVIVQIHAADYLDAIGLLLENNGVDMDAVSTSCSSELRCLYGYHK